MEITARIQYMRIAPRKMRLVANLLKGMPVREAEKELMFLSKHAAVPLLKLLRSAVANAKNNFSLSEKGLYIEKCLVNGGPVLKRTRARAFGRAAMIRKRMSHVVLVLTTNEEQASNGDGVTENAFVEEKETSDTKGARENFGKKTLRDRNSKNIMRANKKGGGVVRKLFNRKAI